MVDVSIFIVCCFVLVVCAVFFEEYLKKIKEPAMDVYIFIAICFLVVASVIFYLGNQ